MPLQVFEREANARQVEVDSCPKLNMCIQFSMIIRKITPLQVYEREASSRQVEVGQLRKTGEAHRKRVKLLEQELASQRIIAKVCSAHHVGWGASCVHSVIH